MNKTTLFPLPDFPEQFDRTILEKDNLREARNELKTKPMQQFLFLAASYSAFFTNQSWFESNKGFIKLVKEDFIKDTAPTLDEPTRRDQLERIRDLCYSRKLHKKPEFQEQRASSSRVQEVVLMGSAAMEEEPVKTLSDYEKEHSLMLSNIDAETFDTLETHYNENLSAYRDYLKDPFVSNRLEQLISFLPPSCLDWYPDCNDLYILDLLQILLDSNPFIFGKYLYDSGDFQKYRNLKHTSQNRGYQDRTTLINEDGEEIFSDDTDKDYIVFVDNDNDHTPFGDIIVDEYALYDQFKVNSPPKEKVKETEKGKEKV